MKKHNITRLALLDEGDKFQFANEDGTLKSERVFFVEAQYPKFSCTTILAEHYIKPCHSYGLYKDDGLHAEMVTAVEDQWVHILQKHAIHICHKVKYLR